MTPFEATRKSHSFDAARTSAKTLRNNLSKVRSRSRYRLHLHANTIKLCDLPRPRPPAHYLHIGKTGGSAVRAALSNVKSQSDYRLYLHDHRTTLLDIPSHAWFFFSFRDPVERFISGFYSRQRKGQPLNYVEWSKEEAKAFAYFGTPNELALALSSTQYAHREAAEDAMRTIQHVRDFQWTWTGGIDGLRSRTQRLIFLLNQECLEKDFATLSKLLGVTGRLPEDDVTAHRNPTNVDKSLTPEAVENLTAWYREDFRFVEYCSKLREEIENTTD